MGDRPAPTEEIEITPEVLESFEDIFEDWKQSDRNAFILEAGGAGNLEDLARRALAWARALS